MSRISGSCITTCGHRFCFKCIEEWVNRRYWLEESGWGLSGVLTNLYPLRHECPVCKHHLNVTNLIRDTGYDALLSKGENFH